eukprot:scaffold947_cov375-Prasinococcus_capsulatus_cf.AAC.11
MPEQPLGGISHCLLLIFPTQWLALYLVHTTFTSPRAPTSGCGRMKGTKTLLCWILANLSKWRWA